MTVCIVGWAHSPFGKLAGETVETLEQLEFLRGLQCDEWQGYLCSKPLPADEIVTVWKQVRGRA